MGAEVKEKRKREPGFLPMETNLFDRFFISAILLVAIHLLWMRFLESYLPLWVATIISVGFGIIIVMRG